MSVRGGLAHPGSNELDAAEEGGGVGVLLRHVGLVWPDPPVQPRHQVDVVGDPPRQLLRRVHVRVDEPGEEDAAGEVDCRRGPGEGREDVGGRSHGGDAVPGDGDGAVLEDAEAAVHADDDPAVEHGDFVSHRRRRRHFCALLQSPRRASVRRRS
jgi:hypothetical protein